MKTNAACPRRPARSLTVTTALFVASFAVGALACDLSGAKDEAAPASSKTPADTTVKAAAKAEATPQPTAHAAASSAVAVAEARPEPGPEETKAPAAGTPSSEAKLELREGLALERDGYVKIFGEVVNGHDKPVSFVRIDIELYSENGELIAEERTYASRRTVPPGERSPFAFTRDVKKLSGKYHHHKLKVSAKPARHDRTLAVSVSESKRESTRILTLGSLRNDTDGPCASPEVVAAGIGADGRVVEVAAIGPTNPDDKWTHVRELGPGESANFRVSLPLRHVSIDRVETFGSCGPDMG